VRVVVVIDLSVLPPDLGALYAVGIAAAEDMVTAGVRAPAAAHEQVPAGPTPRNMLQAEQLELEIESPAESFRRWLESQPLPEWMDVA
jgi:hypothetical protein